MRTVPVVQLPPVNLPLHELRPKVLGLLQNEWVYDPPRLKKAMEFSNNPEAFRRRMISYALFAGCKTGRVLVSAFGDTWRQRITWENASKEIGDVASSAFPADVPHIVARIQEELPDVVIAFGKVAQEGMAEAIHRNLVENVLVIRAPHPCARHSTVLEELRAARRRLEAFDFHHDLPRS